VYAAVLASSVPPVAASYQSKLAPPTPFAVTVVVLPEQIVVVPVKVGAAGIGFTVSVMPAEVALAGAAHPRDEVICTVITLPDAIELLA